jgi:hypothetical protein
VSRQLSAAAYHHNTDLSCRESRLRLQPDFRTLKSGFFDFERLAIFFSRFVHYILHRFLHRFRTAWQTEPQVGQQHRDIFFWFRHRPQPHRQPDILARPATIPRARVAEPGRKANSCDEVSQA